jgi:hypothetical protein
MRAFYLSYANILETAPGRSALPSAGEKFQTASGKSETLTWMPDLAALARYAFEGLPNKVLAAQYRMELPDEKTLAEEIRRTRDLLQRRKGLALPSPRHAQANGASDT